MDRKSSRLAFMPSRMVVCLLPWQILVPVTTNEWLMFCCCRVCGMWVCLWDAGPRLSIKTVSPRYGDPHVKDKTVLLSLTWGFLYWQDNIYWDNPLVSGALAGILLWMCPANERRRYIVTSSLIGWAHTHNDLYFGPFLEVHGFKPWR